MTRIEVHKFGGTSVGSPARMREAAALIHRAVESAGADRVVVVTSAMGGVTDQLVAAAESAAAGDREGALATLVALRQRHAAACTELADGDSGAVLQAELDAFHDELDELLRAVAWLRELTPRTRAVVLATGEKAAARLLAAALRGVGLDRACAYDADTFLDTDGDYAEATPRHGVTEASIQAALGPRLEAGEVPVVTGFCGRSPEGATTLLGRGGSDYTATILGAALGAARVTIWTDVDGVYSADPRVVPEARSIAQLNYREAGELAFYGAKVMHQRTIIPVAGPGIPIAVKSTMQPDMPGTVVDARVSPGSHPVKAISAVRGLALVSIEGKGMAGVPGVAARAFSALAQERISVTMISQSSSETSICLAVREEQARDAEQALLHVFGADLSSGDVEEIVLRRHVGIVAAVGLGMAHTPGVARGTFRAIAAQNVNVLAIAQGASELNISLAVDADAVDGVVRALHREWRLHRRDTGDEAPDGLGLVVVGCGQIGRALLELVVARRDHVRERFGLVPSVVAVCDRSGFAFAPRGLDDATLDQLVAAKRDGVSIASLEVSPDRAKVGAGSPVDMIATALEWRIRRPVLVDVTDDPAGEATWRAGIALGCDVVTANKAPLAGPFESYAALQSAVRDAGVLLRTEATVGAGLPVLDTIEMLLATGDRLEQAEGCLSGTLGFLMTRLGEGLSLSEAVAEAIELGFTEPDPVEDLSGADVERKAVILARLAGFDDGRAEFSVAREGLVPDSFRGLAREDLLDKIRAEIDGPLAERIADCATRGEVLRFVATVQPGGVDVGVRAVAADSPLGMLHGPDNMIVVKSDRYADRPLVVSGPGAGVAVTAMGVFSDILRIAAERQQSS